MHKKYLGPFLMILCAACLCLGQLLWKLMPEYNMVYLLGGFAIYGLGSMLMILAYRHGELSVLQPMNSMSYVFSTILAILILHESVAFINIVGIFLIISGVIIIGIKSR